MVFIILLNVVHVCFLRLLDIINSPIRHLFGPVYPDCIILKLCQIQPTTPPKKSQNRTNSHMRLVGDDLVWRVYFTNQHVCIHSALYYVEYDALTIHLYGMFIGV